MHPPTTYAAEALRWNTSDYVLMEGDSLGIESRGVRFTDEYETMTP